MTGEIERIAAWMPAKCRVPMWMGGCPSGFCSNGCAVLDPGNYSGKCDCGAAKQWPKIDAILARIDALAKGGAS